MRYLYTAFYACFQKEYNALKSTNQFIFYEIDIIL